jgi:hypothetical protein
VNRTVGLCQGQQQCQQYSYDQITRLEGPVLRAEAASHMQCRRYTRVLNGRQSRAHVMLLHTGILPRAPHLVYIGLLAQTRDGAWRRERVG